MRQYRTLCYRLSEHKGGTFNKGILWAVYCKTGKRTFFFVRIFRKYYTELRKPSISELFNKYRSENIKD